MMKLTLRKGKEVPLKGKCLLSLEEIAHSLAQINRFGGHAEIPESVALHSVLVSALCPPEFKRLGLIHDAAEALLGDVVRPLKEDFLVRTTDEDLLSFEEVEDDIQWRILEYTGLQTSNEGLRLVAKLDRLLCDFCERPWLVDADCVGPGHPGWPLFTLARQLAALGWREQKDVWLSWWYNAPQHVDSFRGVREWLLEVGSCTK